MRNLSESDCFEQMGFQSSNLLFANYVIWVEGPSDIFDYEALLNIMDKIKGGKGIKRGVHYELMWYGGKQVKNIIDIESEEGLNLLFSFGRRGSIFWDYDDNGKYAEDLANRIKKFKNKLKIRSRFSFDFCFGITGKIMSENGGKLSKDNYPRTIENLMSEEFGNHALREAFPKTSKQIREKLAKTFEINGTPENDFNKKTLGIAFLKIINSKLETNKPQNVFRSAIAHERYETIRIFFDKLYERILEANGVKDR